ncbi:MAG: triose-phosphate isomerase [Candidatus Nealsonbacteria bacterium]
MKSIIVANWKMNPATLNEARRIFNFVKKGIRNIKSTPVIICPPFVYLPLFTNLGMQIGAQDAFFKDEGAYTGEVSPSMLKSLGVSYVILGHSERRQYFKESNEMVKDKIKAVQQSGLTPILCIDKLSQIPQSTKGLIIAYEPLFAIGTGQACSLDRAKKMRLAIKKKAGERVPVLYGGSVNSENARSYIKEAGFQGLLVGGASLKPKEFIDIIKNVCYR